MRPAANVYGTLTVGQTPVSPLHHSGSSVGALRPATVLPRGQRGLEGGLELLRIISVVGVRHETLTHCFRINQEPLRAAPLPAACLFGILQLALCALASPRPAFSDPHAQ